MLWYKYWLETRWRLVLVLVVFGLPLFAASRNAGATVANLTASISVLWIVTASMTAGTGIKTQSATLGTVKGLHNSTYFTLSLPVRRSTLFGIRTIVGLSVMLVAMLVTSCGICLVLGSAKADVTLAEAVGIGLAMFVCCLAFYFMSSLLSIYLDAQWQLYGSMLVAGIGWWLTRSIHSPFNLYRPFGEALPFVTHIVPWEAMVTSVAVAAVLIVVTLRIIETREF
ncbi:MAG TPA: hypothetical protein VHZ74_12440 [Bryobacteraceae bacterium]|jgi:hypothetical protein|nr:hypothetical protein [Bryobacteraceae bacterium]